MMRSAAFTIPVALILMAAPALASPCSDKIDGLSKRVQSESTASISASTSGQGNAAKRGGEGMTGTEGQRANESPQAPPEKSAQAGQGADAAQQAKVALDEARTADSKGDAQACQAAVSRAEQQLKKAP
ncbi:hypothetical protein [Methylobacterium sp. NEAU K]|uniref:hypothetical protein n=1 Tax=Methylobacterium sp. NEAU K TaxID=3064946 RepID=UPI002735C636|nr:hypothetical protein [Methylobacterium sp. NEAU K]MDP4004619.1 hypothetical protein [Methylobacterium sp. NEAU K]